MKAHLSFVKLLSYCETKQQIALLQTASKEQIDVLSEIAFNFLIENIPSSDTQTKTLAQYKNAIRTVADKKVSTVQKRRVLIKSRKFLPILLKLALKYLD